MTFNFLRFQGGQWVNPFTTTPVVTTSPIKASFGHTQDQLTVSLDGRASSPTTGATLSTLLWDFGDGSTFTFGATTSHTYDSPGTYSITLKVTDTSGATDSMTQTVAVKSTVLEYIADPTPHLNVMLHPASTATAQCIVKSPDTGSWFMSQVHPETTAQFGNTDSLRISRMPPDGSAALDNMLCNYGGHGTSIGVEYRSGQTYIWATYFQPVAGTSRTHDIVRFPYTPGTFDRGSIPGLQVMIPGGVYRRIQFDWINGYCLITEDPTWERYKISDVQAGNLANPLNRITVKTNPPTIQGLATYGDSVFMYTGDGADTVQQGSTMPGGPFTMYEYSWKTGQRVNKVDLSGMLAGPTGVYIDGHMEPESCSIYDTGVNNPVLNFGLISGPAGQHQYFVYDFDLVSQAEAVANRPFALRETKPTASNVGAGILRPVSTTHNGDLTISTPNYVLKDTIVNGAVTIAAPNVVIENCIIKGPGANPGATTTTAAYLINTDNTALATGPALIRYCTITSTWKSPNVYGIAHRNFTVEYCDISKVVEAVRPSAATTGGSASAVIRGNYIHDLIFYVPDPNNATPVGATNVAGQPLSGTWAGKNWNWASGIHLLGNNSTGIEIYGNNIEATWSSDSAVSTTPVPTANARLNALRITGGSKLVIEDNWLDGGEQCLYSPGTTTTGNAARNKFGRGMARTGTTDGGYYALFVTSANLVTNDNSTVDDNVWQDTGNTVFRRAS